MNGNRFYVHPAGDLSQGLQGLNQAIQGFGEKRRVDEMNQAAVDAYKSGDPDRIAEVSLQYPEIGQFLTQQGMFRSERTKQNFLDSAYSVLADPSEENVSRVASARQTFLRAQGQTDEDMPFTGAFLENYRENPEQALNELKMDVAGLDPDRWIKYRESFPEEQAGEPFTLSPGQTRFGPEGEEIASVESLDKGQGYEMQTIYGPDGQTSRVPIEKGTQYTPPKGWSLAKPDKGPSDKAGVSYLLRDRSRVTSFDGGRTYRDEAGKDVTMPFDALRISATVSGTELDMMDAQSQVGESEGGEDMQAIGSREVGEGGTGPYSMLKSAIDRVAGGLGADKLFGKEGFFPETQENRQILRTIKQLGKAALMNSSRGAIWEQERIDRLFPDPDKVFTNPRTEAKKFIVLRDTLLQEKNFNNEAIKAAVTPKEVADLRKANIDINRLLSLIGTGQEVGGGPQIGTIEDGYTFKGGDPADPNSWEKAK